MVPVKTKKLIPRTTSSLLLLSLFGGAAMLRAQDPPTRVLRLNYMQGAVSAQPAGVDDWAPAVVNRPFSIGDYLYTDSNSRAELVTDIARIRLDQITNIGVLNITDNSVQLKETEGDLFIRVHNLWENQSFEVDTPNAAVTLLRNGSYRVHVDPNQNTSWVAVYGGQAEITGGGQAFTLNSGNTASLSGTDQLAYDVEAAGGQDDFDSWCINRDHNYEARQPRYIPPTVVGYEDLEGNGEWTDAPQYGHVWYPTTVQAGWSPYHYGHWAWVDPWGWTWVDDAPWGFAPFHYGRWVYWQNRWGWAPGPMAVAGYGGPGVSVSVGFGGGYARPCYAPALVAWFGGSHFSVGISIGGGAPSVGWVPLGYGEVYTPSYHVSQNYFQTVNVSNTTIVKNVNITNVYNNVYVNKTTYNTTYVNSQAPNAVVAMPQNSFASGRPVAQQAHVLQANQVAQLRSAGATVAAPPVAPTREATLSTLGSRSAPHPPAAQLQKPVFAKNTPPPPPVAFQARAQAIHQAVQSGNGAPVNIAHVQQQARASAPRAAAPAPAVHVVSAPSHPQVVQAGARVGNVPPAAHPANSPAAVNRPGQPNQPFNQNRPGTPALQNRPGNPPVQNRPNEPVANPAIQNRPGNVTPNAERPSTPPPATHGLPPNRANQNNVPAQPRVNTPPPVNDRPQPRVNTPPPANDRPQPRANEEPRYNQPPRNTEPQARPETARPAQPAPRQETVPAPREHGNPPAPRTESAPAPQPREHGVPPAASHNNPPAERAAQPGHSNPPAEKHGTPPPPAKEKEKKPEHR